MRFPLTARPLRLAVALVLAAACDDPVSTRDPHAIARVSVRPSAATLVPGQDLQLAGEALDGSRNPLPDEPVSWTSADPSLATVSAEGLVEPLLPGQVEILVSAGPYTTTSRLTIVDGAYIGPAGGTVSAFEGAIALTVPENAVAAPVAIQIARLADAPLDPTATDGGFAVRFSGTFAAPAALTLAYQAATGPAGVPESAYGVRRLEGGEWEALDGSTVDVAGDVASAPITAPGSYGVGRMPPAAPCTAPEHRQFDFWLGTWGVAPTGSPPGTRQADSFITGEPGGCAVFEDFRDLDVRGESINVYDPGTGQWYQTFVDNTGTRLVLVGGVVGSDMVLTEPDDASRITWSLSGTEVRQLGEVSADAGATWGPQFDLTYRPR